MSPYGRVLVVEHGDRRCLKFSLRGAEQTCIDLQAPDRILHEYVRYLSVGLPFVGPSPRVLMIGLGGGAAIRMFTQHNPEIELDVVEINPVVVEAARDYFGVRESAKVRIHVADGRAFVERTSELWDMIVLDAFDESYVPFPLSTVDFMRVVSSRLGPDGIVVSNLWTTNGPLFRAFLATHSGVFSDVFVFRGSSSGNAIVVSSLGHKVQTCEGMRQVARAYDASQPHSLDIEKRIARCEPASAYDLGDAPILSDDRPGQFRNLLKL